MAETKVLLAVSKSMPTQGARGEWSELKQSDDYIVGIDSGEFSETAVYSSDELAKDVTGFPSAWARANFIKLALSRYKMDPKGLLDSIYRNLRDEWLGLVTLIATEASKITVDVVKLTTDDESSFSLASLLGDVLFLDEDDKTSLWYDKEVEEGKVPFIQIIRYDGKIVGASSPNTLIFPAVKYSCDVEWFDKEKLRFGAPDLGKLTERQLKDLYLVQSKIEKGLETEGLADARDVLREIIRDWMRDVEKVADRRGIKVIKTGVLGSKLPFVGKLGQALACDDKIYEYQGRYYFDRHEGDCEVNLGDYLLANNSNICELVYGSNSAKKKPEDLGVYVLMPADDGNGRHFFPLPLTEEGLKKWCDSDEKVTNLLKAFDRTDKEAASRPHIEADLQGETLHVKLSILVQDDVKEFKRKYTVKKFPKADSRSCILWPNFVSPIWRDYYMYTECLEDTVSGMITRPLFFYYPDEDIVEQRKFIISENENHDTKLVTGLLDSANGFQVNLNPEKGWSQDTKFEVEKIVKDRGNSSAKNHYDVWHSNKPIAGVALVSKDGMSADDQVCGYLLFRKLKEVKKFNVEDDTRQVKLGMDFGSNNSCVYFKKKRGGKDAEPLEFRNMRVFALGEDKGENHNDNAEPNELLFFQNETKIGQFKSWVVTTDSSLTLSESYKTHAVCGGMNTFEPNLAIESLDAQRGIMELTGVGSMHYNMKWRSIRSDDDANAREIFVDSVWRQAVANLFVQQSMVPCEFKWSYPGAFTQPLIRGLFKLYYKVVRDNYCPICIPEDFVIKVPGEKNAMTEADAVLSSIGSKVDVDSKNIVIAMDIGGSTTDLLVKYQNKDGRDCVVQSSVCMAAGSVTSLFEKSDDLRKAVVNFQKAHPEELPIVSVGNLQTDKDLSYYCINMVFDIVAEHSKESWTKGLYEEFARSGNKSIEAFALPAYIAGFLTFYTGMLLRNILEKDGNTTLEEVTIHPVGKGSRILDWLKTRSLGGEDSCTEYLENCLRAGLRDEKYKKVHLEFKFKNDPKAVVAQGLVQGTTDDIEAEQIILFGEQGLVNKASGAEVDMELNLQKDFAQAYGARLRLESNADKLFPVFNSFCDTFLNYLKENEIVENSAVKALREALKEMRPNTLGAWISHQPTFMDAAEDDDFEYKESYLVLESLYFLEKSLLPIVTKDY